MFFVLAYINYRLDPSFKLGDSALTEFISDHARSLKRVRN